MDPFIKTYYSCHIEADPCLGPVKVDILSKGVVILVFSSHVASSHKCDHASSKRAKIMGDIPTKTTTTTGHVQMWYSCV